MKATINMKTSMKKKSLYAVLSVLLAGTLCSCGFTGSGQKTSQMDSIYEKNIDRSKQHVTLDIDTVAHIDADYTVPDALSSMKMYKIEAHRPSVDAENCKSFFFGEGKSVKKGLDKGYHSREFGKYDIKQYWDKYGGLECTPMDITYSSYSEEYERISNGIQTNDLFDSYNLDKYSQEKEFSFASRKEIFQKIKTAYHDLAGIEISDDYTAYALDHKTLKEQQAVLQKEGLVDSLIKDWNEKDDTYYFILHQEVSGVPIRQKGYGEGYRSTGVEDTVLTVFYNRDGWVEFDENWGYCIEETTEEQDIMDISEALASFKKKCDMLTTNDTALEITAIDLELVPVFLKDNDYEIRPVWVFQGPPSLSSGGYNGMDEIMFDAITGKELIG